MVNLPVPLLENGEIAAWFAANGGISCEMKTTRHHDFRQGIAKARQAGDGGLDGA
jgi:hypothetical protein